jgi:hypothetical protein
MRHFVVAATARSETTHRSIALSRLGYRCGREQVFSPWKPWGLQGWRGFDGDVSCFAAPYLVDLPYDTLVFHQVLDPLSTIRSLASWGIFRPFFGPSSCHAHCSLMARQAPMELSLEFMKAHTRDVWHRHAGEFARAAQNWVDWNRLIQRTCEEVGLEYIWLRVEDMQGSMLSRVERLIGGHHATTLHDLGRPINSNGSSRFADASLSDLPRDLSQDVAALATMYGYADDNVPGVRTMFQPS